MKAFEVEENRVKNNFEIKIKVIGVGGGGGNMINHIVKEGINKISGMKKVELIAANTDAQVLEKSLAYSLIQLGEKKVSCGLGAGAKPEVGRAAAEESAEEIRNAIEGANIVFIAAGFGGGTGTGAAPVIARIAKEAGALTIAVVTTPFKFEFAQRMRLALTGIEELKKECDNIIVIPNEKLRSIIDKKATYIETLKIVDAVLADAVTGMSSIILDDGYINVDFNDVKSVMAHRGGSLLSVGGATSGEGAAVEAIKVAIQSPLLEDIDIKGAKGLLVNFRFHPDHPFEDIANAGTYLQDIVGDDGNVEMFVGTLDDENMPIDEVRVTLIATGIQSREAEPMDPKPIVKSTLRTGTDGGDLFNDFLDNTGGFKPRPLPKTEEELDRPAIIRRKMD